MKKIFYIEDSFLQFNQLQSELSKENIYPEIKDHEEFLLTIQNFLDPIGNTIEEQESMRKREKEKLDAIIQNTNIFILDYYLEKFASSGTKLTGINFYKKYLLNNENIKDLKVLFVSSSVTKIKELKNDPQLQNPNFMFLVKSNNTAQWKKIEKWIKDS